MKRYDMKRKIAAALSLAMLSGLAAPSVVAPEALYDYIVESHLERERDERS